MQGWLKRRIRSRAPGPSEAQRRGATARLWGEASDESGRRVAARLRTPDGYTLTALTVVAAAERVLAGGARPGFQTPSRAFGPDFILEVDGVAREDLPEQSGVRE